MNRWRRSYLEDLIYLSVWRRLSDGFSQELLRVSRQLYDDQHHLSLFCCGGLLSLRRQAGTRRSATQRTKFWPEPPYQDVFNNRKPQCKELLETRWLLCRLQHVSVSSTNLFTPVHQGFEAVTKAS